MSSLKKAITPIGLTMVAIGSCIGAGIFKTPSKIAAVLPYPNHILIVWAIGGLVTLTGALTFSELTNRFPKSGGVYVFLKEAFGDTVAFLYGWVIFAVITTGAIASLALVFAQYLATIFPMGDVGIKIAAIGAILIVTAVNSVGVERSDLFVKIFTGLKILGIGMLISIGLLYAVDDNGFVSETIQKSSSEQSLPSAYAIALIGVFFSYGGWQHASFVAGEVKNASKIVPRAMILGAIIVTLIYLLANVSYLSLLDLNEIGTSKAVASDALNKVFPNAGSLLALLIVISTFGTIGIYTLSAPRVYHSMSKDKVFFPFLAKTHPKFKTPMNAMIFQSAWSIVILIGLGTFENIINYAVFMDWVFLTLAAIGLFVLRRKYGNDVAFKVPLYPIVPLIFIVINIWFLFQLLSTGLHQAYYGIGVLLIGVPFYLYFKMKYKNG